MTDRELLALAAKAAGLPVEMDVEGGIGWFACGRDSDGNVISWWNPLKDDGDALRLAITLKLTVSPDIYGASAYLEHGKFCVRVPYTGTTIAAATRRAIVRVAAEIGKIMP